MIPLPYVVGLIIATVIATTMYHMFSYRRRNTMKVVVITAIAVGWMVFLLNSPISPSDSVGEGIGTIFGPTTEQRPEECGDKTTGTTIVYECDKGGRVCESKAVSCEVQEE